MKRVTQPVGARGTMLSAVAVVAALAALLALAPFASAASDPIASGTTIIKLNKGFVKKLKNSGVKLMGFGHRVYKNYDPRAKLMRETCHEVLNELGLHDDRLFKLAMALEKIALEDDYFVQRKLYPNVDFYSGIVQRALGIPTSMFTCVFALARTVGWIA